MAVHVVLKSSPAQQHLLIMHSLGTEFGASAASEHPLGGQDQEGRKVDLQE